MKSAPALKIYAAVRDYAHANGLPYWTWRDVVKARQTYLIWQSDKN